jgi:hypothetical protein
LGVAGAAAVFSAGFVAPVPAAEAGGFEGTGAFGSSGFDILFTLRFYYMPAEEIFDAKSRNENLYDGR